jgi:AbrB family looped-hinge helix DNA binding protein
MTIVFVAAELQIAPTGIILLSSYFSRGANAVPTTQKMTTTVSTKGQVVLPKSIRQQRRWVAGMELVVEDTPDGVLLRPAPAFPPTRPEAVFKSLPYKGPPKSIADMNAGIAAEVKRRHARDRY